MRSACCSTSCSGGTHSDAGATGAPLDQMRAVVETEPRRLSEGAAPCAPDRLASNRAHLARRPGQHRRPGIEEVAAERYANAQLFADDLRRYLNDEPVTARRDTISYCSPSSCGGIARGGGRGRRRDSTAVGVGVALWEAGEAKRRRVQAEGLIEFMLGDLRKKLQPVGRLDVLDAVGEKAFAYYAAQDQAGSMPIRSAGAPARCT